MANVRQGCLLSLACVLGGMGITPGIAPAQTSSEIVLHSFANLPKGEFPYAGVIRDSAGNLYGTTILGGAFCKGVVYKVDSAGHQTVLYSFTGEADGSIPYAGVIGDSAGNLYGTASQGGTPGHGVVYKLDSAGHQTVLYSFTGGADGGDPLAGLVRDSAGNLYGTANAGGTAGMGAVYKLDTTGQETVLYSFTGGADGRGPVAGVIRDSAGNLYGTTQLGGAANAGVVYKVDTTGKETVLYTFTGGADGGDPLAGVIRDSAGNLYGTTFLGGASGVVYKLDPAGNETVLYSFSGGSDGALPQAGVTRDSAGNLYGTTQNGGIANAGVVYKLAVSGQETVLYNFTGGADGYQPFAGVILDSAGNLYGTTSAGGTVAAGVVYQVDTTGHETVLYGFTGGADGSQPYAGVMHDAAGNLYGTTCAGGPANAGAVYKLDAQDNETVLYRFTGGVDGRCPHAGLTADSVGNLYGTTVFGGTANQGVVYKLDAAGQLTVLYSFTGGADGGNPYAGVIGDSAGNLYGTTSNGGRDWGVVFKLDTTGRQTVLHRFAGGTDGQYPMAGVVRDAAGNLYGTTQQGGSAGFGIVYKLDTAGNETVLYSFGGGTLGGFLDAGVILDAAGNLYGTTASFGLSEAGVVFKLDPSGQETVLLSFNGSDGSLPEAGLILDSAGNLYGTTNGGGAWGFGEVFELNTAGQVTLLYSFTGGTDGRYPAGATLMRDSSGNIYGTTPTGGTAGGGVVFEIRAP